MTWADRVYTRKDLYEEVWTKPVSKLADKFGMSGVALAKHCRQMGVPRPSRGYWAKKAHGQDPARIPLRNMENALAKRTFRVWTGPGDPPPPELPNQILGPAEPPVLVAERLEHPHPLIEELAERLRKAGLDTSRARAKQRCLNVRASEESLDRALRILDALFRECEAKGWTAEVTAAVVRPEYPSRGWNEVRSADSRTGLRQGEEFVEIAIAEALDRVEVPAPPPAPEPPAPKRRRRGFDFHPSPPPPPKPEPIYEERPTGRLSLEILAPEYGIQIRRHWRDYAKKRLEESLRDVVDEIERYKAQKQAARDEAERRRRAEAERQCVQDLAVAQHVKLVGRARRLDRHLEAWEYARRLRRYVRGVRRLMPHQNEQGAKWLDEYVTWVRQFAEWIDPETNPKLVFDRRFRLGKLLASSTKTYDYPRGVPDYGPLPIGDGAPEQADEEEPAPSRPPSSPTDYPRPYWPEKSWYSR